MININKLFLKKNLLKTLMWFKEMVPMLFGILLLISMFKELGLFKYLANYLGDSFFSVIIADIFGSISAWSTINSYIIADSIWNLQDNMLVITTFLIAWITVWFIQIPAEIYFFGRKFTVIRNITSFIFAIIAAYIIYFLMNI